MRIGDYKVVQIGIDDPFEVYDLKNDISESNNIALDQQNLIAKAKEILKIVRTESEIWKLPEPLSV